jgi:hypothetical protein
MFANIPKHANIKRIRSILLTSKKASKKFANSAHPIDYKSATNGGKDFYKRRNINFLLCSIQNSISLLKCKYVSYYTVHHYNFLVALCVLFYICQRNLLRSEMVWRKAVVCQRTCVSTRYYFVEMSFLLVKTGGPALKNLFTVQWPNS